MGTQDTIKQDENQVDRNLKTLPDPQDSDEKKTDISTKEASVEPAQQSTNDTPSLEEAPLVNKDQDGTLSDEVLDTGLIHEHNRANHSPDQCELCVGLDHFVEEEF